MKSSKPPLNQLLCLLSSVVFNIKNHLNKVTIIIVIEKPEINKHFENMLENKSRFQNINVFTVNWDKTYWKSIFSKISYPVFILIFTRY